jgi:polar amino acid transport system substrate-binding protein
MKRFIPVFAAVLGLMVANFAAAASFDEIRRTGTLRVGITMAEPWTFRTEDGEYEGFEIAVARKLADDMDVDVEFVRYAYDELIRGIEAGEIDLIAAGFTITPARALHVNFSNPYATGGIGIATNSRTTAEVERLDQLNSSEFTIATITDSVAQDLAARVFPRANNRTYGSEDAAIEALVAGDADVYLEQEPVPTFLELEYPRQIDVPVNQPLLATPTGFAVAKGDPEFLAFLNAWIVAREADTWLPSTYEYWFRSLSWRASE